ncbi:MAG TPA: glycosyltransferase family 4 protein [Caldisericia bacterium]|nr:glycosyltransferase family 4 protein [Caldisericia bacterium]
MKPTITFLMSSVGTAYGGSETYTINIARKLCSDFHIKLILGHGRFTDDFKILIRDYPIEFLSVPFISRHSKISTLWKRTRFYKKINDFDIEALTVMASLKKIRRFISDTDILEVHYPTESLIFPFLSKQIKKVMHFHGYALPPLYNFFNKKISQYIHSCIACSRWSKGILEQKTEIKGIKVIYNGVDPDLFKPDINNSFNVNEHYDPSLPRIGTVGRLSKEKGTDLFIRVAKEMSGLAEFFAVGPYDEEILSVTKKLNAVNFHIIGSLPNNLLHNFYNFIDCYVLPSLFEAFGITVIEAMACNKCVIASNVGGIPEIIDNGINGILIEPGDYNSLKKTIAMILNSKDLQMNLGEQARQKVLDNFTHEVTYKELKNFYFNLLA